MVFSLGIALIGGIILMFVMVYQRHQAKLEGTLPDHQLEASEKRCKGGELTLKGVGMIKDVKSGGDGILIVVSERGDKERISIIDYCANRLVNKIDAN